MVSISSSAMLGNNHLNNTRYMSQLCTSQNQNKISLLCEA